MCTRPMCLMAISQVLSVRFPSYLLCTYGRNLEFYHWAEDKQCLGMLISALAWAQE